MIITNLIQGSGEWHAHRAKHFNASDAPAMLGESKYKTRSQLLKEIKTGITEDIDAMTQKVFEDGHRFEALARPLAEEIIGQELSPVTGSFHNLSASFDGITFDGDVIWEHKTLNKELDLVFDFTTAITDIELPLMHRIQMEQQLLISGAGKCLFMASKWIGETLVEEHHRFYYPDFELRQRIIGGWAQFEIDLSNYVPAEVIGKPKAASIMALPSLAIQIKGEVTLSNLPEFENAATAYIAQISTTFVTDEDFSNGEAAAKFCKDAEDNIEATKKAAIAQTASIDELMRTLDHIKGQLRDKRLIIEKLVIKEKEARKDDMCRKAVFALMNHAQSLEAEIAPIKLMTTASNFGLVIKGKKNLSSMQDAIDTELARCKIEVDAIARDLRAKANWYRDVLNTKGDWYNSLFADLQTIIYKPLSDFKLIVDTRISNQQRLEAERAEKAAYNQKMSLDEVMANAAAPTQDDARLEAERKKFQNGIEAQAKKMAETQSDVTGFSKITFVKQLCRDLNFSQFDNEYHATLVELIALCEAYRESMATEAEAA